MKLNRLVNYLCTLVGILRSEVEVQEPLVIYCGIPL